MDIQVHDEIFVVVRVDFARLRVEPEVLAITCDPEEALKLLQDYEDLAEEDEQIGLYPGKALWDWSVEASHDLTERIKARVQVEEPEGVPV